MSRFTKSSTLFFCFLLSLQCSKSATGPGNGVSLTGTFIGDYTASANPGVIYQGVLQLTQAESHVTGTLTTNAGRSANFSGDVSGSRLSGTLTFTDGCSGSATSTADIADSGRRLAGNYSASDCLGPYTGGYLLVRSTSGGTINFALDFNQSWATVPDNITLGVRNHWTIEAWIYPRDASNGRQHLVSKWNGSPNASYAFVIEAGHLSLEVNDGVNPTDFVNSKGTLANNVWQHVAVSFDSGTARLYINGALDTTVTSLVIPNTSDRPLSFGHEGPPYNGWLYNGVVDEIRLWNVTRTGAQIGASIASPGSTPGLVGYWRFNEGSGDVTSDATGHGLNAQLGNAVGADANDPQWTTNAAPVP